MNNLTAQPELPPVVKEPLLSHRTKTTLAIIVGIFLGLGLVTGIAAYFGYQSYQHMFVKTNQPMVAPLVENPEITPSPSPTPDPLAPFGVLLLGFGGGTHDGGYLTDTMMIAYVQPRDEKITLISLPRDLWVQLPVSEQESKPFKINAAYAIGRDDRRYPDKPLEYTGEGGGGSLAKNVVGSVTGLPMKYFVALSFDGFVKSIDVIGGVPVNVPVTFDDPLYPIEEKKNDTCGISEEELVTRTATLSGQKLEQSFECRYELLHFEKGLQTLDGTTALKYARSRHSNQYGGDFARSERQKTILVSVKNQIFSLQFLPKLIPFISTLTRDMQTDIPLDVVREWIGKSEEYRSYEIDSIAITEQNVLEYGYSSDRQYILKPKTGEFEWSGIQEFVKTEFEKSDGN